MKWAVRRERKGRAECGPSVGMADRQLKLQPTLYCLLAARYGQLT